MNSFFDNKRTTNIIRYLLLGIVLLFIASLFLRRPDGDEAIIAEHSYWLQKIGYVKSVMFTGLGFGWEYAQYHYHKLFVIMGALSIKLFGIHELALRIIVLAFTLLLLRYMYLYSKDTLTFNSTSSSVLFLFLFFQYHFFNFSFIFRPEIPVVTLGFLSFYFLHSFLTIRKYKYIALSSVLAGCAVLVHLNGMIFIVAGGGLLLMRKEFKHLFTFLIISGITSLFYFFNITSIEALNTFLYQFTNDPNLSHADFSVWLKVNRIIGEHLRYFHSPKEIVLSLLFFFLLITNFKKLYSAHRTLVQYTLLVLLGLAVIAHDKTDKYSLLYVPFMIIVIVYSLVGFQMTNTLYRRTVIALTVLYFTVNAVFIGKAIDIGPNHVDINQYYSTLMPQKHTFVLARESFFFNEMENYQLITTMSFELQWKRLHTGEPTESDFYNFAKQYNVQYIILENKSSNQAILNLARFLQLHENDATGGYIVRHKTNDFALLERHTTE